MSNVLLEFLDLGDVLVATPALTPYDRRSSATVLQDDHARAVVGALRYGVGWLQLLQNCVHQRLLLHGGVQIQTVDCQGWRDRDDSVRGRGFDDRFQEGRHLRLSQVFCPPPLHGTRSCSDFLRLYLSDLLQLLWKHVQLHLPHDRLVTVSLRTSGGLKRSRKNRRIFALVASDVRVASVYFCYLNDSRTLLLQSNEVSLGEKHAKLFPRRVLDLKRARSFY
mmetsp:Transcript_10390/g.18816  ORF Transcript_10390/g.18816 Transcript_10390/m.18816 type:complete len:222 (+) Transcript_10390:277-942(+)